MAHRVHRLSIEECHLVIRSSDLSIQPSDSSTRRYDLGIAIALGLVLLAIYLATTDLSFHMIDEPGSFTVSRNLWARGTLETDVIFWVRVPLGRGSIVASGTDKHTYVTKDFVPLLLDVPFVELGHLLGTSPVRSALLLFPLITAITGSLIYIGLRKWEYSIATGILAALTFGLTTLAWPYAGMLFSQPLASLGLLIAVFAAVTAREKRNWQAALVAGLGVGLAGASSSSPWVTAPIFILYLIPWEDFGHISFWELIRKAFPILAAFCVGASVFGVSQFIYNAIRFGSVLSTGHDQNGTMDIRPMYFGQGGFGQLLSTPRGLIWFAPFSLLIPVGVVLGWHTQRRWLSLAFPVALIMWMFTSFHYTWWGGHAWGPRYLISIMSILTLLTVPALDRITQSATAFWVRLLMALILVLSALTQLLAVLVNWLTTEVDVSYQLHLVTPPKTFFVHDAVLIDLSIVPQLRLIKTALKGDWDVLWITQGKIDVLTLLAGLFVVAFTIAGLFLIVRRHLTNSVRKSLLIGELAIVCGLAFFLLMRYSDSPYEVPGLNAAIHELDAHTVKGDGVLSLLPVSYLDWIDSYDGSNHDIGVQMEDPLSLRTEAMLEQISKWHDRIWLISEGTTGGNPHNGVELWLANHGYVGQEIWTEGFRIVPYSFSPDVDMKPVNVSFGDSTIQLESYALSWATNNHWINVHLRWIALKKATQEYTVFIHILREDGTVAAQHDGLPAAGYAAETTWQLGNKVDDRHQIELLYLMPPGEYQVEVGLYDPVTGVRLPLSDHSSDSVIIETLKIGP